MGIFRVEIFRGGGDSPGGNFPDTVKNEWPSAYNCRILYFSVKNKLLFDIPDLIFKMICLFNMNPANVCLFKVNN